MDNEIGLSKVKYCQIEVICGQIGVMPRPTTPAQYVLILLDLAEQAGCQRPQLLQGTSLASTGIENIGARVDDRDFNRLG